MKKLKYYFIALLFGLTACGNKTKNNKKNCNSKQQLKVVSISNGSIDDDIILFGFYNLSKKKFNYRFYTFIYYKVNVKLGDKVSKDLLYVLQSKEMSIR